MPVKLTDSQVLEGPDQGRLESYFLTAISRYGVYRRRSRQRSLPWSDDPIFQKYRFCNVYREHDKVTVWLRENWREPYADHPNLAFAMALARLINWPPTLEEIGFPERWSSKRVTDIIRKRQEKGYKTYTAAYLLGAIPKGAVKAEYLANEVLTPLYKSLRRLKDSEFPDTLELAWLFFKSFQGIGDFLAYEIVSDLRHTRYLRDAPDINYWANAGPGALRGLTRLWGYQPKTSKDSGFIFPQKHALDAMRDILKISHNRLPGWVPPWEMREVEHWLCEFDKYMRIKEGQGVLERFTPKQAGEW